MHISDVYYIRKYPIIFFNVADLTKKHGDDGKNAQLQQQSLKKPVSYYECTIFALKKVLKFRMLILVFQ